MSDAASTEDGDRPPSVGGQVEEICDRAEAAWQAGRRPRIEDDLGAVPESGRAVLLRALLELELAYRHRKGERPTPEEYHRRFPQHDELIDAVFAQVEPPTSRADSVDDAVTQSYCVATPDGGLGPPLGFGGHRQLQAAFTPGVVLQGRYTLERELGRGGMGQVYLGRDDRLLRPVAIKVILPPGPGGWNGATSQVRFREESFAEEARLGANLTHIAIATVYDFGFHEGKPFTVFEYLPGETLGELLRRRGRLPLEEVRLILGPLAQALDFAHARHVVHRDLKPENIRSTDQGSFKVLDLGLAKDFHRHADWAGFCGTPAYASPEQAAGLACDGRSDQYALALITFKMLTGQPVFEARDGKELLEMHRSAVPTWADDVLADTPATVRQALARALCKDPNARFTTCGDFAVALGCQLLNVPAPPPVVLLEADVRRMTIGRFGQRFSISRFLGKAHLALTDEAIWSVQHAEVRRWLLRDIERLEKCAGYRSTDAEAWRRLLRDTEQGDLRVTLPEFPEKGGPTETAAVRLANRGREADFIRIGWVLSCSAMIAFAFASGGIAIGLVEKGVEFLSAPKFDMVLVGLLGGILFCFGLGRGLRRLRPWARWVTLAGLVGFLLVPVVGIAVAVWHSRATSGHPVTDVLRVSWLPAVAWLFAFGFPAYYLASRKSKVVFSRVYRSIIDQTPYLKPSLFGNNQFWDEVTLRLKLRAESNGCPSVSFRFATEEECQRWFGKIAAMLGQMPAPACEAAQDLPPRPVVLMTRRPPMRYQVLGPLEARADTRRVAEAGLQVRAAMIDADAVLDIQEEVLPEFHRTVRRLSGTAVRAVDAEGRFEFRSRWYADRVARIGNWAVTLIVVSYGGHLLGSALASSVSPIFFETDETPLASRLAIAGLLGLFVTTIHAWPATLAILLRLLRWPQLVRPLAVTIVALGSLSAFSLIAIFLGAFSTGRWGRLAYRLLLYLDPSTLILQLSLLLSGLVVCRAAWRADHEYRRLVPEDVRRAPWRRVLGGRLAWAGAGVYATLLAGFCLWSGFVNPVSLPRAHIDASHHFSLTAPRNWTHIPPAAIYVPGEVIRAWSTPDGAVVVVFNQKSGQTITPRALLDTTDKSVKQQLQAEVTTAEVRTVAGMRAMWLVFTAKGTGQALGGEGNVPTTQHWIAIPREKDVLVLLLTTPADRFQAASQEFAELLETLRVDGKQTGETSQDTASPSRAF